MMPCCATLRCAVPRCAVLCCVLCIMDKYLCGGRPSFPQIEDLSQVERPHLQACINHHHHRRQINRRRSYFLTESLPSVCPEPVLVKRSYMPTKSGRTKTDRRFLLLLGLTSLSLMTNDRPSSSTSALPSSPARGSARATKSVFL
eukprot:COSAG06_NODE_29432_length_556_cov_1.466083_2_plen_144_part_01